MKKLVFAAALLSACLALAGAPVKAKARAKTAPTAEAATASPQIDGLGTSSAKRKGPSRATHLPKKAGVDTATPSK